MTTPELPFSEQVRLGFKNPYAVANYIEALEAEVKVLKDQLAIASEWQREYEKVRDFKARG